MHNHNNYNKPLFQTTTLDDYLRAVSEKLRVHIKNIEPKTLLTTDEGSLITELKEKYSVNVPTLFEDKITIDAQEADIEIKNHERFLYDEPRGPVITKGLKISVSLPYEGSAELFECRPSTYIVSGYPHGDILSGSLMLKYETAEKDSEKIKTFWQKDIEQIKQNLGWIERDLSRHNQDLEQTIKTHLTSRKKEAQNNQSLIDAIKS